MHSMTEIEALKACLREFYSEGDECEEGGFTFKLVSREEGENRRWSRWVYRVSASSSGKYWQTGRDEGLTENQDNGDFEPPVEVQRIETVVTKTVVTYKPC